MISKQTLYLTADREKVVKAGDPKAAFLLVKEGHEISDELAEKYDVNTIKTPEPSNESSNAGPVPTNREKEQAKKRRTRKK